MSDTLPTTGTSQETANASQTANVQTPATPAPQSTTVNPEDTAQYWRDKYNGQKGYITSLQNQMQTLQTNYEQVATAKDTFATEAETTINGLQVQVQSLTHELSVFKPQVEQLTAEKSAIERQVEVGKMVRSEFGVLASLYDQGLLDDAIGKREGDELKTFLQSYATTLGSMAEQSHTKSVTTQVAGSTPQPQTQQRQNASVDPAKLQIELAQVAKDKGFNSPEYKEKMQLYMDALSQLPAQ